MACEASGGEGIRSQTMDQTDARESSINNQQHQKKGSFRVCTHILFRNTAVLFIITIRLGRSFDSASALPRENTIRIRSSTTPRCRRCRPQPHCDRPAVGTAHALPANCCKSGWCPQIADAGQVAAGSG